MDMTIKDPKKTNESPIFSILASVVIPIVILNKLSGQDPLTVLIIALAFPVGYGAYSYIKNGSMSFVALLGLLNTLFTGGFAVLKLEGFWFAVKEAAFPCLIGVFVFFSSFTKSPFLKFMLLDSGGLNTSVIYETIINKNVLDRFKKMVRDYTMVFSISFFVNGLIQFFLALHIFKPISNQLSETEQSQILNQQIADMTWQSMAVITVPTMLALAALFYFFLRGLTKMTGLQFEQMVNEK